MAEPERCRRLMELDQEMKLKICELKSMMKKGGLASSVNELDEVIEEMNKGKNVNTNSNKR